MYIWSSLAIVLVSGCTRASRIGCRGPAQRRQRARLRRPCRGLLGGADGQRRGLVYAGLYIFVEAMGSLV